MESSKVCRIDGLRARAKIDCTEPKNFLNPICETKDISPDWEPSERVENTWQLKDGMSEKTYLGHNQKYPWLQIQKNYDSAKGKVIGFRVEIVFYHYQNSLALTDTDAEAVAFAKNAMKLSEDRLSEWAWKGGTLDLRKHK